MRLNDILASIIKKTYPSREREVVIKYYPTDKHGRYQKNTYDAFERIIAKQESLEKKRAVRESCLKFNEYAWRLDQRYQWIKGAESVMYYSDEHPNELQLDFVNRIEAYFQQLYASLGALNLFLSHSTPHSHAFRRGMKIGSIANLLKFLEGKTGLDLKEELPQMEAARVFRSKHIDHVEQHILHDWMTVSYPKPVSNSPASAVVYFIRNPEDSGVYHRGFNIDPYSSEWRPPFNCKDFYVSPQHDVTHEAFFSMATKIVVHVSSLNNGE